jgi:hypothetical protein
MLHPQIIELVELRLAKSFIDETLRGFDTECIAMTVDKGQYVLHYRIEFNKPVGPAELCHAHEISVTESLAPSSIETDEQTRIKKAGNNASLNMLS